MKPFAITSITTSHNSPDLSTHTSESCQKSSRGSTKRRGNAPKSWIPGLSSSSWTRIVTNWSTGSSKKMVGSSFVIRIIERLLGMQQQARAMIDKFDEIRKGKFVRKESFQMLRASWPAPQQRKCFSRPQNPFEA